MIRNASQSGDRRKDAHYVGSRLNGRAKEHRPMIRHVVADADDSRTRRCRSSVGADLRCLTELPGGLLIARSDRWSPVPIMIRFAIAGT